MPSGLGKCSCGCGRDAGVVYPLLPGSPAFCSEHHNPHDAGRFGCDFSGPDDFDIPFGDEDVPFCPPKPVVLHRATYVWTDANGVRHPLADIDDGYLSNIIGYLRRGRGRLRPGLSRDTLIEFLENEQRERIGAN